jgi:hypothetical protein
LERSKKFGFASSEFLLLLVGGVYYILIFDDIPYDLLYDLRRSMLFEKIPIGVGRVVRRSCRLVFEGINGCDRIEGRELYHQRHYETPRTLVERKRGVGKEGGKMEEKLHYARHGNL